MKKNTRFLGITLGLFTFFGVAIAANFSDIAGHWAENDLIWAVDNGLLKGDEVIEGEEKTLRPNDAVTRAELATVLRRYDERGETVRDIGNTPNDFEATVNGVTSKKTPVLPALSLRTN